MLTDGCLATGGEGEFAREVEDGAADGRPERAAAAAQGPQCARPGGACHQGPALGRPRIPVRPLGGGVPGGANIMTRSVLVKEEVPEKASLCVTESLVCVCSAADHLVYECWDSSTLNCLKIARAIASMPVQTYKPPSRCVLNGDGCPHLFLRDRSSSTLGCCDVPPNLTAPPSLIFHWCMAKYLVESKLQAQNCSVFRCRCGRCLTTWPTFGRTSGTPTALHRPRTRRVPCCLPDQARGI